MENYKKHWERTSENVNAKRMVVSLDQRKKAVILKLKRKEV